MLLSLAIRCPWYQTAPDAGVVVARAERKSELVRPNKFGQIKPVAANLDQLLITIAPVPHAHTSLVDRYLVAAEVSHLEAVIVLNKSDLLTLAEDNRLSNLMRRYAKLGYKSLITSCEDGTGLDQLHTLAGNRWSVFVGQSGVGKSSLINALLPEGQPAYRRLV